MVNSVFSSPTSGLKLFGDMKQSDQYKAKLTVEED
jgi:hypothetical protein